MKVKINNVEFNFNEIDIIKLCGYSGKSLEIFKDSESDEIIEVYKNSIEKIKLAFLDGSLTEEDKISYTLNEYQIKLNLIVLGAYISDYEGVDSHKERVEDCKEFQNTLFNINMKNEYFTKVDTAKNAALRSLTGLVNHAVENEIEDSEEVDNKVAALMCSTKLGDKK